MDKIEDGKIVGATRGAKIKKRWNPKEWRPEYEAMVGLACTGLSYNEIGNRFGYTSVHVGNIVNSDMGKALQRIILDKLRKNNTESLAERIDALKTKALSRVEHFINNDDYADKSPLAMFDRSFKFLTGSRVLSDDKGDGANHNTPIQINNKTVIVTTETSKAFAEGIASLKRISELHNVDAKDITP
jgi:hypothetical protein